MNPEHRTANNTAEQSIDRVLSALRNATPSAGMERRLLRALELESRAPAKPSPPRFGFAWMAAACCAALAVAALVVGVKLHHSDTRAIVAVQHAAPPTQATSVETAGTPAITTGRPTATHHVPPLTPAVRNEEASANTAPEYTAEISHPAPPIPLTGQEKLLLHYAQHGHTSDLAQISNEKTSAKEEQEKADFVAFFTPPPPPPMTGESE